jgi:hypothetical protein
MKTAIMGAAAAVLALVAAGAASAYSFTPTATNFTAQGSATFVMGGVSTTCAAAVQGKVNAKGVPMFNSVSLSGSSACAAIQATGLHWNLRASSLSAGRIMTASFVSASTTCGPGNIRIAVDGAGGISFSNAPLGACTLSASLATSPALSIVP